MKILSIYALISDIFNQLKQYLKLTYFMGGKVQMREESEDNQENGSGKTERTFQKSCS
jgi:hypothetical protein